jgi:metallo-beta-lactamase family protein
MKLEFVGGARSVTGSCFIIKDHDFTIMVDCGMFQGKRELRDRNTMNLVYNPPEIDILILTHAHIDHSGLIPKLVKNGFRGDIYATKATKDLCEIMLPDSAHIQEMDAKWVNRKNRKLGRDKIDPIYTIEDAEESIKQFKPVQYGKKTQIHPRVEICFRDAGHILGSSFVEMWVDHGGKVSKIVFSGDLGPNNQALIRDPEIIDDADFLLIESTYGNRLHKSKEDTYSEFKEIIQESHNSKGNIIIPAFAIERTQEIIYSLGKMVRSNEIPEMPVYIDSPLAISATEIFRKNKNLFDEETRKILLSGNSPLDFENLFFTRSTKESKKLNEEAKGSIIISASGMCTAGRIKFHLQNNLYKKNSSVIFVGYQAEGTLGRRIIEGAKQVRVYGEDVAVNAKIHTLGGFSAHADRDGLLNWIGNIKNPDLRVFVVHGEVEASMGLAGAISSELGLNAYVPKWGEIIDLVEEEYQHVRYESTGPITDIDKEIEEFTLTFNDLVEKYTIAKNENRALDAKRLKEDISDIREILAEVVDEI